MADEEDPELDYDDSHAAAEHDEAEQSQSLPEAGHQSAGEGEMRSPSHAGNTVKDTELIEMLGKTKGCIASGGVTYPIAGCPTNPPSEAEHVSPHSPSTNLSLIHI